MKQDLRKIRTQVLSYTQERMAAALGVSLRTYARHESRGPSRTIILLATRMADEKFTLKSQESPLTKVGC